MSPEVVAALLGVVVGILGDRLTRYMGRLWYETSDWSMTFYGGEDALGNTVELSEAPTQEPDFVTYSFSLDMFNGREIPTGLRDISVVLVCEGGQLVNEPDDLGTRTLYASNPGFPPGYRYDKVGVINLPPREWVHKELQGEFRTEGEIKVETWQKAILVGKWPSLLRKDFTKHIAVRERAADRTWWRRRLRG